MRYEWGPWIEHDGKCFPQSLVGQYVWAKGLTYLGRDQETIGHCNGRDAALHYAWDWRFYGQKAPGRNWRISKVLRYRIRRPLVREYLQEITETLPEMEDA